MKKQLKLAFIPFLMLAFLSAFLYSQAKYGTIEGKAIDTEGAPLPGVEVKLSSPNLIGGTQSQMRWANSDFPLFHREGMFLRLLWEDLFLLKERISDSLSDKQLL